jgi:hypothetical protein
VYFQQQCEAGGKVAMMWVPGVGHGFIARDSADTAVNWIMDRFGDRPAPSDCGKPVSATARQKLPASGAD